jgi:hypothetical protein
MQISHVNQSVERKPKHKNKVPAMYGVTQENQTADHRYVPECDRDVRTFFVFADYPLQDESAAEYHLAHETHCEPEWVAGHLLRYCAFEKLYYRMQHKFAPIRLWPGFLGQLQGPSLVFAETSFAKYTIT